MHAMSRSKRMKPVQRVAESREQAAVQKLGQSQQFLDAQRARLEELCAYRNQYSQSFQTSGGQGLNANRLQDYRVFLSRLNEAIHQQEAIIVQCTSQHELTRQQWVETRSRHQAIDKVIERYRSEEQKNSDRLEQQEQDERAQRPMNKSR
ncbi:flagellar FliJ protein [Thiogranum longum]|uniref:Flagellar FliJ protein n=2 Tax=Thiogranum longum TaxID=1537524 RepID=A0A4R1HNJ9_9GAMM|nr:flagellar FliJ protein [Thiogranum longum]